MTGTTVGTVAVAVTGGLDSYLGWRLAESQDLSRVAFHLDFGHRSSLVERAALATVGINYQALSIDLVNNPVYEKLDSSIVPGRNLLIATIGASFGSRVWICAAKGEMHPYSNRDKSEEWYLQTSAALTYSWLPLRPKTVVEAPLGHLTKAGAISLALQDGVTEEELRLTRSCYHPVIGRCGECAACFHRWVAMSVNDITETHRTDPWTTARARGEILAMLKEDAEQPAVRKYDLLRVAETRLAMDRAGGQLVLD